MSRRPALVTQADIQRAVRAVERVGGSNVNVRPDGEGVVITFDPPEEGTDDSAVVYFIRCGDFVKIGTTTNIANRQNSMLTDNPFEIELLLTKKGSVSVERAFHEQFSAHRHRREWFRLEGSLKDWIEREKKSQ